MIDIKLLQKDFDTVATALQKKGVDNELLNNLKILSINTKQKRQEMEDVTAEQNLLSKEFGRYKKENLDITALQENINNLKNKKQQLEEEFKYEEAIKQLEDLVEKLENDELDIDSMSENLKKAQRLIKLCKDKLTKTDDEINKILETDKK